MKKCLIVVDYQYEKKEENGLLTAGNSARDIEVFLYNKVNEYIERGHDVIFTLDTHTKADWNIHPESRCFPLHCEKGEKGHELFGKLNVFMNDSRVNFLEKSAYCPDFKFLEKAVFEYDEISVCGVVTDICVLQTVIGLYTTKVNLKKGTRLCVYENGCASFDDKKHCDAINYMKSVIGAEILKNAD